MRLDTNHNKGTFVSANLLQVAAIHVVALGVAPFFFTGGALLFAAASTLLFSYAMGIFHHMQLTHRSFKSALWVENLGSLLGTLTWRGPFAGPVRYIAMHRVHHRYADTDLDPHSPVHGKFHALLGWFWRMPYGFVKFDRYAPLAPDVIQNPWHVRLDRHVHLSQLLWGALCFVGGAALPFLSGAGAPDPMNGLRYTIYGVFVRAFLTIYLVNAVDLINHTIGYRNYETPDGSTNSFLTALLHGGGAVSWHNNHHAHMGYFTVRKQAWEFDLHHWILRVLQSLGLVWDIRVLDEVRGTRAAPAAHEVEPEIEDTAKRTRG